MAGRLYNLHLANLVHTYDSGGKVQLPGVMIGNENSNLGVAPDNDPADTGLDVFINARNGQGPQLNGENPGVYIDLDTGTSRGGTPYLFGVDDSDADNDFDFVLIGPSSERPDGILGVHMSGTEDDTIDGIGQTVESQPAGEDASGIIMGSPLGVLGLFDTDYT